jgi:hypothetical protein
MTGEISNSSIRIAVILHFKKSVAFHTGIDVIWMKFHYEHVKQTIVKQ